MYKDSNSNTDTFDIYKGWGDQSNAPLGKTIAQVKAQKLQSIAWNDQLTASQGAGNSQRAHSKFFMSLKSKSNGFAIVHSAPNYPTISDQGDFTNPQIDGSQKKKAQHIFCFTVRGKEQAEKILQNSCFIKPNIYHNSLEYDCKQIKTNDNFLFENYQVSKTLLRAIYKNGNTQSDIFTEGITHLVESSIVIQTFGSPRPYPPYCDGHYTVGNSQQIAVAEGIRWTQGSDHSKWAYALDNDFACFGDLNRNTVKQQKRGGSFYCLENPYLNGALRGINPEHSGC